MTDLRRLEGVAGEQLPVQDEAAPHSGAYEDAHHVSISPGRAEAVLSQDAQIHVVADEEGHAEAFLHGGAHVIVPHGQVGGEQHHPGLLVDDPGDAGGNGGDLLHGDAGGVQQLLHHGEDHLLHVLQPFSVFRGLFLDAVHRLPGLVEDGPQDLGPPHVQTDPIFLRHGLTSFSVFPLRRGF